MTENDAANGSAVCPWCSAPLPVEPTPLCPSCGATLHGDGDAALPGITAVDPAAAVRLARNAVPQRRSRLVSWITGDEPEDAAAEPAAPGSLAPPPPEVRREMLRMELAAEVADLEAEAVALAVEAHEAELEAEAQDLAAVADDAAALADDLAAPGEAVAPPAGPPPVTAPPPDAAPDGSVRAP